MPCPYCGSPLYTCPDCGMVFCTLILSGLPTLPHHSRTLAKVPTVCPGSGKRVEKVQK